jgi:hypothetical protein
MYAIALGIVDDVENLNLKGSKTKKSKSMDIDYMVSTTSSPFLSLFITPEFLSSNVLFFW